MLPRLAVVVSIALAWVRLGANSDPATPDRSAVPASAGTPAPSTRHWSFRPHSRPPPPALPDSAAAWPRSDLDRFVLSRLLEAGLAPAPEADRVTWLRRVTFDLVGLPPTPEQIDAFLADSGSDSHDRVVDRLLASPRYGERWGQHWLDVVRFADTHGFEVNTERPNAWPYRDYVIRAFNRDTPYDRFIREQIVGDILGEDAATGFLLTASVLLPGQIGADEPSKRLARQDALDEIVVNISQTFLGLSVGCARCHDHKTDPIPQADYYSMQAFVAGVEYEDRDLRTPEAEALRMEEKRLKARSAELDNQLARLAPLSGTGIPRPGVRARLNVDRFPPAPARRLRFTIRATNNLEPCLDECEVLDLAGTNVALASYGTTVASTGDSVSPNRHELRFVHDGVYGNSRSWMSSETGKGQITFEFPTERIIDRVLWSRDREGQFSDRLATDYVIEVASEDGEWRQVSDASDRAKPDANAPRNDTPPTQGFRPEEIELGKRLHAERREVETSISAMAEGQRAFAGLFRKPDLVRVLRRGDPEQPKEEVAPAVLRMLGSLRLDPGAADQERRRALADWIASPENPLAARVLVNRVWQGHFGTGLVDTPNDFGRGGSPPSHPELLDWLASEFVRSGWSVKSLHRLVTLSATYRQSNRIDPDAERRDADVRLLWRFPSRRLEAEAIRDSMLAVSGRLNLRMYGRGFDLFDKRGGLSGFEPVETFPTNALRRMIYAHKVRRERDAIFGSFDCPDAGQSTARRRESTTPIQALNLFNSTFTLNEADALGYRVRDQSGPEPRPQVRTAYRLAFGRFPRPDELREAEAVVGSHGAGVLARALFNANEFLFLP